MSQFLEMPVVAVGFNGFIYIQCIGALTRMTKGKFIFTALGFISGLTRAQVNTACSSVVFVGTGR